MGFIQAIVACAIVIHPSVAELGSSQNTGCLQRYVCNPANPAPFDPDKLTIVCTHGWNPLPRRVRLTTPQAYAQAICNRCGDRVNVFGYDWNAGSFVSLSGKVNSQNAVCKGRQMARELMQMGVRPEKTWLIGHSLGALLMSGAANELGKQQPIARLTLLDAVRVQHGEIFGELNVRCHAQSVENYFAVLPSGFGKFSRYPGVYNRLVRGKSPIRGALNPARGNHAHVVEWYYNTVCNPCIADGFNR